jgi:xanthine dehydrogenase accessory factor
MRLSDLAVLNGERLARRATVFVTDLESGEQRVVKAAEAGSDPLADAIEERLRLGKSGVVAFQDRTYFLAVQSPPVRLVIVGAVHIAQALTPMARLADLDVTVVDPRTAFAVQERFADARVLADWPQDVLAELRLDRYTAIALLSHDPRIDDPALTAALRAECFYIGALGSRKTHGRRLERLRAEGFADDQFPRIHAPVGLDIGAVSPAEIAVSILGEIVLSMRKKPQRSVEVAA